MIPKKKSERGHYILCARCSTAGGTLVKDGKGGYVHQDKRRCAIMRMRVKK